ncbi:MAG: pseudouridine synthase [Ferruginibacter sp.]
MSKEPNRYFILNKPYNMVSQFVSSHKVNLLGDLDFDFPEGTHAIGRLDNNSEGLLLLTTNKKVTRLLFSSDEKHERVYLVQVNNILSQENLQRLRSGVMIRIKGNENYTTPACDVTLIEHPETLYNFEKEISKNYGPHTWLLITLTEGKYHQVRKMIAAVRHRCKRLIRVSIEDIQLKGLAPGAVREMEEKDFFNKLRIG